MHCTYYSTLHLHLYGVDHPGNLSGRFQHSSGIPVSSTNYQTPSLRTRLHLVSASVSVIQSHYSPSTDFVSRSDRTNRSREQLISPTKDTAPVCHKPTCIAHRVPQRGGVPHTGIPATRAAGTATGRGTQKASSARPGTAWSPWQPML